MTNDTANDTFPIFFTFSSDVYEKYRHELKIQIIFEDGTDIYVIPPVMDRKYFADIDWSKTKEELMDDMAKTADLITSYLSGRKWQEWCYG